MKLYLKFSKSFRQFIFDGLSWLHLERSSVHIAATLQATWALLFWRMWSAAVDRALLLDERSFNASYFTSSHDIKKVEFQYPNLII